MVRVALGMVAALALALGAVGCGGQEPGTEEKKDSGSASSGSGSGSGSASSGSQGAVPEADIQSTPELEAAVEEYQDYAVEQADQLVQDTARFTEAVIAGDVEGAKELYAPARLPWERLEPIAATLGDLDPAIDAREGDLPDDEWGGFHRIERALWIDDTAEGQEEYARQLQDDVEQIQEQVQAAELEPADLVTGSIELLNEVSADKITGEEERYSRIDLYDMSANVEGSQAAYEALSPVLEEQDPALVQEIDQRFEDVYAVFDSFREGDGYVPYTDVTEEERRRISQSVDALAEPLSRIGQVLEA